MVQEIEGMREREKKSHGIEEHYQYIVVMGISTGGPKLLSRLVTQLDETLSATYLVVQHMPQGFTKSLADRLNTLSPIEVKEAENGEVLKRGVMYIAPGGKHLKISGTLVPKILITNEEPYQGHKPSVNKMLNSLVEMEHLTKKYVVVIMTGMGTDGLEGVTHLKQKGNCEVIAQNQETSTVYGMPKAIVNAGLADYIVPGENITQIIKKIVGDNNGS